MKKSLQKFTKAEGKIHLLMQKIKIEQSDVDKALNDKEKLQFRKYLAKNLNELKGDAKDLFVAKVCSILPEKIKNQMWEFNHYKITASIHNHIANYGVMPNKTLIAKESGLSRQTVYLHLHDYSTNPFRDEQTIKFNVMRDQLLMTVYKIAAVNGNVKAARLYFEVLGCLGSPSRLTATISTQNNYIQINQTKLSQERIKELNTGQLLQIEEFIKSVIPMKDDE